MNAGEAEPLTPHEPTRPPKLELVIPEDVSPIDEQEAWRLAVKKGYEDAQAQELADRQPAE